MKVLTPITMHLTRPMIVILLAIAMAVALAGSPTILAAMQGSSPISTSILTNKKMLKDQVDTTSGSPRDGRDPASQVQTSLAQAASNPNGGTGNRTDKPAAGISGSHSTRPAVKSSDVYGDPSVTGINDAGCFVNYGAPGQQCVPASLGDSSMGGMLMCDGVHTKFPNGVKVIGTDRFGLDSNHDGIACGPHDLP